MFENVFKMFNNILKKSIIKQQKPKGRKSKPLFYTYVRCNGTKLAKFFEQFDLISMTNGKITLFHLFELKCLIDYAGKGINERMLSHLLNEKNSGKMVKNAKNKKIEKFGIRRKAYL